MQKTLLTLKTLLMISLEKAPLVSRFLKGIFNLRTDLLKIVTTLNLSKDYKNTNNSSNF